MKGFIEISRAALLSNYRAVGAAIGPKYEVLGVVKADAYGHGAALCAPVLAAAGLRWFGVGDLEEGLQVRAALAAAGWDRPRVLVMCGFDPADAPGLVTAGLTPVVWTAAHLFALEQAAVPTGQIVAVHVEIDSGMARQGAAPGVPLAHLLQALETAPHIRVEGLFSHLSSSEVAASAETAMQCTRFQAAIAQVHAAGIRPMWLHLGNTSAIDEGSTLDWLRQQAEAIGAQAMVRPGLALYGYALATVPDVHPTQLHPNLSLVASWTTHIVGLREIPAGEAVGYGATFVAERPMRLALLPVGYADGFRREASSGVGDGWVIIAGQRAPVVGRVSMNLTVVDVTALAGAVHEGDQAILLGAGVTAEDHARWSGTISYEILCSMRGCRLLT